MSLLFGFYDYGLRTMNAARLGIAVSGDNISNVNTPGYAKRRMDLQPGFPTKTRYGMLDQGVEVADIRRVESALLQRTLEREQGSLGFSDQRLRGLADVENIFGPIDGNGIISGSDTSGCQYTGKISAKWDRSAVYQVDEFELFGSGCGLLLGQYTGLAVISDEDSKTMFSAIVENAGRTVAFAIEYEKL